MLDQRMSPPLSRRAFAAWVVLEFSICLITVRWVPAQESPVATLSQNDQTRETVDSTPDAPAVDDPVGNPIENEIREEELPVLHVADDGTAPFDSIQAAVDAAAENAIVRIAPGTYSGPIRITKPIILEGAGWQESMLTAAWKSLEELAESGALDDDSRERLDEILWRIGHTDGDEYGAALGDLAREFGPKPTLSVENTTGVVVRGLRISTQGAERNHWGTFPMMLIADAGVRIRDCVFGSSHVDGLVVRGDSEVECRNCLVAAIRDTGITVETSEASRAHIVDCDIRNCDYSGVNIRGSGEITIENCRISGMRFHGVKYKDSSPTVTGNVFFRMNRGGIYTDGDTRATVRDNLFLGCSVSVRGENRDLIEHNTFVYRNAVPGAAWTDETAIWVNDDSRPTILRNLVSQYRHGAVFTGDPTEQMVLEGNVFDTTLSPVARGERDAATGEYLELPLPAGNQSTEIRFADPDDGDFAISNAQSIRDRDVGARQILTLESPWPELPEEREILDAAE